MNYVTRIENAPSVTADRAIPKNQYAGRLVQAMAELHTMERVMQLQTFPLEEANLALKRENDRLQGHLDDARAARGQLHGDVDTLESDNEALTAEIERLKAENKTLTQKLFTTHSLRSRLARQVESLRGEPEAKPEFPKGTGRITQLREYSKRYPGVKLTSDGMFMLGDVVVGELA